MDLFGQQGPQIEEEADPPSQETPAAEPVRHARPDLWPEILAVLCIAAFPGIWSEVYARMLPLPVAPPNLHYAASLVLAVLVGWPVLFFMRRSSTSLSAYGFARPSFEDVGLGAVLLLLNWGLFIAFHGPRSSADSPFVSSVVHPVPTFFGFMLMVGGVCASALRQEMVYRAYLVTRMEVATTSVLFAVSAAAGVFAGGHAYQGMHGVIEAFVFALLYGVAFVLVRRLWPLVLAHAAWNLWLILR